MGIRGLTTFINQHERLLKNDADIRNSSVVIDGYALLATLMRRTALQFGGNYRDLYKVFFQFFTLLQFHHVTIHVILDGGNNFPVKLNTWVKRKEKVISSVKTFYTHGRLTYDLPKPVFATQVFIRVLQDLNIKYVFAEREADAVTAVIANKLKSFAVTNDSDFFIFDVVIGVISVTDILDITKEYSKVKVYHMQNLIKFLTIDKNVLNYFPAILGCDYSDDAMLGRIQDKLSISSSHMLTKKFEIIKEQTLKNTFFEILCDTNVTSSDIRDEINKVLSEYDLKKVEKETETLLAILFTVETPTIDFTLFNNSPTRTLDHSLLNALKLMVHRGRLHGSVLDIYVSRVKLHGISAENVARTSCAFPSLNVRKFIYALLFNSSSKDEMITMTEYVRKGDTMKQVNVNFTEQKIPNLSHSTDTFKLFCKVVNFEHVLEKDLLDHALFLVTTNYLINQSNSSRLGINIEYVETLLTTYLLLQDNNDKCCIQRVSFSSDLAHLSCCWQAILFDFIMLNTLLGEPLIVPPIYRMFDGELLHSVCTQFRRGKTAADYLSIGQLEIYHKLLNLLLSINTGVIETNSRATRNYSNPQHSNSSRKQPRNDNRSQRSQSNRYAPLSNENYYL